MSQDRSQIHSRHHISAKHACSADELNFCRIHIAMREANANEAFRRAFTKDCFEEADDGSLKEKLTAREVGKRVEALLKRRHVIEYLEELRTTLPGEQARAALIDAVLFGDGEQVSAAEKLLKQEDKLGTREATMEWAALMCAIGAEVVVPLPVQCGRCGEPFESAVPMGTLIPRFDNITPPLDALRKTEKSLEDYLANVRRRIAEAEPAQAVVEGRA